MGRVRQHGLRCLAYAVGVLLLAPVVAEFFLRVCAFRAASKPRPNALQPAVVASPVMHHQLAPLQQWSWKPTDDAMSVEFRTNSLGLRGSEIAIPKPNDVFRIVCVGDETTLAADVPEEKTYALRLADRLRPFAKTKIEVINAAIPQSSPVLQTLQMRHQLAGLQADLIIAHLEISDPAEHRHDLRLTDLGADELPLACTHPQLSATPKIQSACEHFLCVNWAKQKVQSWVQQQSPAVHDELPRDFTQWLKDPVFSDPDELKTFIQSYDRLAATMGRSGTRLMVVVHPWMEHALSKSADATESTKRNADAWRPVFAQFEESTGILVCFVDPYLRRLPKPEDALQADHRHLTESGHDLYSYAIAASILHRLPGPWSLPSRNESDGPVHNASHQTPADRD